LQSGPNEVVEVELSQFRHMIAKLIGCDPNFRHFVEPSKLNASSFGLGSRVPNQRRFSFLS
jgi:hypothetical protein